MYFTVEVDETTDRIVETIASKVEGLIDTGLVMDISKLFVEMCDPYVPYRTGRLAHSATPSGQGVTYYAPYAEEQYERMDTNFTREYHPLATGHWDKAMLTNQGDEFYAKVKDIIMDKAANELGGHLKWKR